MLVRYTRLCQLSRTVLFASVLGSRRRLLIAVRCPRRCRSGAAIGRATLRLILGPALTIVLANIGSTIIAISAHVVVAPEERLHPLLNSRVTQLGDVADLRELANSISPKIKNERTTAEIERTDTPRDSDEAVVGPNHGVFETPVIGNYEVSNGAPARTALQHHRRTDDYASLEDATLLTAIVAIECLIGGPWAAGNNLPLRRSRGTDNLSERALRSGISN
jgi:hypothetical protein